MARSEYNHHEGQPHFWRHTPSDMITFYERLSRPLSKDALHVLLEPLAGTSFLPMALHTMQEQFSVQREYGEPTPYIITPNVLYAAFFKDLDEQSINDDIQGAARTDAEMALWSHLSHNVALPSIYPDERLSPGEMAFWQIRHDTVWHDPEHTQEAFSHAIGQWRFYTDGVQVGTIPMQSIYYAKRRGAFYRATIIPEGSPSLDFFHDYRISGIAALPPELQAFTSHTRLLLISEQFDFHRALKKEKSQEGQGRR